MKRVKTEIYETIQKPSPHVPPPPWAFALLQKGKPIFNFILSQHIASCWRLFPTTCATRSGTRSESFTLKW